MVSDETKTESAKAFEPLEIMGVFWVVFGVVVLAATFFVKATPQVPLIRGVVTNIVGGMLLLGAGIFSVTKGRARKRKKTGRS